jgi:hypothetical protein
MRRCLLFRDGDCLVMFTWYSSIVYSCSHRKVLTSETTFFSFVEGISMPDPDQKNSLQAAGVPC